MSNLPNDNGQISNNNGRTSNPQPELFTGESPLAQLNTLITAAQASKATRLLLLAGKPILCRINGQLSDPIKSERLHFRQTQALVHTLLTEEQITTLDKDGAIEIEYYLTTNPNQPAQPQQTKPVQINIFYGDGAHNLIVFLE